MVFKHVIAIKIEGDKDDLKFSEIWTSHPIFTVNGQSLCPLINLCKKYYYNSVQLNFLWVIGQDLCPITLFLRENMCRTLVHLSPNFLRIKLNFHTGVLTMHSDRTHFCVRSYLIGHIFVSDHTWSDTILRPITVRLLYKRTPLCVRLKNISLFIL